MSRFYDCLPPLLDEGTPFALGIITSIRGSSPQKKGAKALFLPDGRILGTLGGGCLEAEIQDRARRALRTGEAARFDLVLDHDFGWDDGLICGGRVEGIILPRAPEAHEIWRRLAERSELLEWGIRADFSIDWVSDSDDTWFYRETVEPPSLLWIAGSGHVAQAVAPMAIPMEFAVTVFDDRPALASPAHFPQGTQFRVGPWPELLDEPFPSRPTFGMIATRGHQHDALVLARWVRHPFAFLGMIGSGRKRRLIFEQFITDGIATTAQLERVACPVGLDIGAISVPEIALSVMAQLVAVRAGSAGHRGGGPAGARARPPDALALPRSLAQEPV